MVIVIMYTNVHYQPNIITILPYLIIFRRDRVPTYLVNEWELDCAMWDGDAISGPVPSLFADNAELAKKALTADPAKAHQVTFTSVNIHKVQTIAPYTIFT